jgi:hypothetical protein
MGTKAASRQTTSFRNHPLAGLGPWAFSPRRQRRGRAGQARGRGEFWWRSSLVGFRFKVRLRPLSHAEVTRHGQDYDERTNDAEDAHDLVPTSDRCFATLYVDPRREWREHRNLLSTDWTDAEFAAWVCAGRARRLVLARAAENWVPAFAGKRN